MCAAPLHLKVGPAGLSSSRSSTPSLASQGQENHDPLHARKRSQKLPGREEQPTEGTNEKATINLIRRVLCPQTVGYGSSSPPPVEELLPPLTSSNDVDRELYALLAIIIREFVYSWYAKITPDQALINEVLLVIAHCTRALEQRLRTTDIAQLLFDEIPALVEAHIISRRVAQQQSPLSELSESARSTYHALHPHPALSPVPDGSTPQTVAQQLDNETAYRQLLAHGVLAILLPTEDLENVALRTLVGDVVGELILGREVSGRICEGWFLWEMTTRLIHDRQHPKHGNSGTANAPPAQKGPLEASRSLASKESGRKGRWSRMLSRASVLLWNLAQNIYLTYVALRFLAVGLFSAASARTATTSSTPGSSLRSGHPAKKPKQEPPNSDRLSTKCPILQYRLYGMLSQLLQLPNRMPWLAGQLALCQYLLVHGPGRLGDTGAVLDRFLHQTIDTCLLTPALLLNILRLARTALFPANARPQPAPPPASAPTSASNTASSLQTPTSNATITTTDSTNTVGRPSMITVPIPIPPPQRTPSQSEIRAIKRQCAVAILSLLPRPLARHLLGVTDAFIQQQELQQQQLASETADTDTEDTLLTAEVEESLLLDAIESDLLDLFADEYCNKHLVYGIIETVLIRLLPELEERSVRDLFEDRGVGLTSY